MRDANHIAELGLREVLRLAVLRDAASQGDEEARLSKLMTVKKADAL